ncbi:MAG TPA: sorbosone dehydrogenase family protein [Xanthobacteraceae bacterium]|nr:sorbosone dehydrogenase family protein [Xanthobacteraceae bacterium]
MPASNHPRVVARPVNATPRIPSGFHVELFASGLSGPRAMQVAPNGDVFISETRAGRVRVLRAENGATKPNANEIFSSNLNRPFGIAFYPPGPDPQWIYIANTDSVVRFRYANGDLKAQGRPETVVSQLPRGGHTTRDIAFSKDGARMFVSVGSASNSGEGMERSRAHPTVSNWDKQHGLGAAWGSETERADVLMFDPQGKGRRIFAAGIRNCVGLAVHPSSGEVWCSVNERDDLGDNLVPDYITRVREGAFYGWPWYYIGSNEDPQHRGERPDLNDKVTVPDVLIQSHSASMQMAFYTGTQFPPDMRDSAFAAQHGSWNRAKRTGYKIIRLPLRDGAPTGEYEDFMTGFVINDQRVWGRPVGIAVARDGALLISEDGNGTVWRVSYGGKQSSR